MLCSIFVKYHLKGEQTLSWRQSNTSWQEGKSFFLSWDGSLCYCCLLTINYNSKSKRDLMSDDFFVEYRCRDKATVSSVTFFFSMAQDTPTKQTRQGYYSTIWYLIAAETATKFLFSLEAFHRPMKNHKNSQILSRTFYTLLIRPYSDAFSRLTFNKRANGAKRGRGTWDSQVTFVFIP